MNDEKKQDEIVELLVNIYYELKSIRKKIRKNTRDINIDGRCIMKCKLNNKKEDNFEKQELNDYNKIILKNLESRICILEKKSQKYRIN